MINLDDGFVEGEQIEHLGIRLELHVRKVQVRLGAEPLN